MTAPWTADTGDGHYRNPILYADFSDPDVIGVGDDFFMTASSFNRVPGLPLLHSTDLVNWRLVGHALERLRPEDFYRTPRHGCGVWAPALRHHDGRFWIVYPDPDHGIYVTTSDDPAGTWTEPRLILPGSGLIDPCPLWDDDGNTYLVHGWAKSRCGFNNRLTAYRMRPDLTGPLDTGTVIVDGDSIPGCRTLEGPKWYQHDGWYWIFAPGGGVQHGWQYAMRSRDVLGPYEPRIVLTQGDTTVNGPHQGAWVQTPAGESWFLHFQDLHAYGRVVHLQPMTWDGNGWPVIGDRGAPVRRHRKPATTTHTPRPFAGTPEWTWPANPEPGWSTRLPDADGLRLLCRPGDDLRKAPAVLGRRLPGPRVRAETTVHLDAGIGARAGLTVLGQAYCWIGLEQRPGGPVLVCRTADAAGEAERDVSPPVPVDRPVRLAVTVADGAITRFAADSGTGWTQYGPPVQATPGHWIGATLGLFALGSHGHADFGPLVIAASEEP
ncbi:beta-xylosidase [Actinoplanes lutulentus]|uniref:Beta-xylosidase n=1 Tax=Actinoplanes lutulentus TaxID=1287878 RepID=A0A327ZBF4_9ACTN|nr:glycoside hydrolase 43 family protein [Actinoplanes lutulentus]MBB2947285.1 beta-xylosidase [Actinoplanes lutulentus]RAK36560.1 beta-xylosidase [Actinoplanes lutulentus]